MSGTGWGRTSRDTTFLLLSQALKALENISCCCYYCDGSETGNKKVNSEDLKTLEEPERSLDIGWKGRRGESNVTWAFCPWLLWMMGSREGEGCFYREAQSARGHGGIRQKGRGRSWIGPGESPWGMSLRDVEVQGNIQVRKLQNWLIVPLFVFSPLPLPTNTRI